MQQVEVFSKTGFTPGATGKVQSHGYEPREECHPRSSVHPCHSRERSRSGAGHDEAHAGSVRESNAERIIARMKGRQFVYRFNGDEKTQEVVVDADGEIPIPLTGSQIMRNGSPWKVVTVTTQTSANPREFPIHWVFLSNKS